MNSNLPAPQNGFFTPPDWKDFPDGRLREDRQLFRGKHGSQVLVRQEKVVLIDGARMLIEKMYGFG